MLVVMTMIIIPKPVNAQTDYDPAFALVTIGRHIVKKVGNEFVIDEANRGDKKIAVFVGYKKDKNGYSYLYIKKTTSTGEMSYGAREKYSCDRFEEQATNTMTAQDAYAIFEKIVSQYGIAVAAPKLSDCEKGSFSGANPASVQKKKKLNKSTKK